MSVTVLDGSALAERRTPLMAARAAAVQRRRARPPALVIVAFGDERGRVPHVARKARMCAASGVAATTLLLPPDTSTDRAIGRMDTALREGAFDGMFLQFPFPDSINGDALAAALPVELDVDIMTSARTDAFLNGTASLPPVTVSACLHLLDGYDVSIADRHGIVVADETPFALMFRAALVRRGADMEGLVSPAAADMPERAAGADLVVVAAAAPGLMQSQALSPGTVAVDVGYFNPGGRGDIDISSGIDHLKAIAPVPGGIGPMTISSLIERVVLFAETAMK